LGVPLTVEFSRDGYVYPYKPTSSVGTVEPAKITLTLTGQSVANQNLPVDPSGVVYDSDTRLAVGGATVRISCSNCTSAFDPSIHLAGGSAAQQVVTPSSGSDRGSYAFFLNSVAPEGDYILTVTPPSGFLVSSKILACSMALQVPSSVSTTSGYVMVQNNTTPPTSSAANPGACSLASNRSTTQYFLKVHMSGSSAAVLNNHIPVDPVNNDAVKVIKTSPLMSVTKGGLVPYTISIENQLTTALSGIYLNDLLPAGFKYRAGSSVLDGKTVADPAISGRNAVWSLPVLPAKVGATTTKVTLSMILLVGAGVAEGEYINQAWGEARLTGIPAWRVSNIASASVRVIADTVFDCSDVIGKVFDDKNANGYQDEGEGGIPAVRIITPRGLLITTDAEGRFHVPCADIPQADRGSNYVMKLDERTLPSGYRLTTENPRDVRLTRGKMEKINFGATIHRVVRLDLNDGAFISGAAELNETYRSQLGSLITVIGQQPSVVRVAYRVGGDARELAVSRVAGVRRAMTQLWNVQHRRAPLIIEEEFVEAQK
jgi:uncharacterized repeat protein (TIGR01451 family)